jgi:hypothetical protein
MAKQDLLNLAEPEADFAEVRVPFSVALQDS